jgi:penicillin-binding protein 1A
VRGTGRRARIPGRETAAKTGTTQAARDAWYLGFSADYVTGVWMGYDDNTPLTGVTGGGLPADIWRETMQRIHEDLPARPLPMLRVDRPPTVQDPFGNRNRRNGGGTADDFLLNLLGALFGNQNR